MEILKLVKWKSNEDKGMFYLEISPETGLIMNPRGRCPHVFTFLRVLSSILGKEDWEELKKAHRERKNPWGIVERVGMSGCRDFKLVFNCLDRTGLSRVIFDIGSEVHISMYRKLNYGVRIKYPDIYPLISRVKFEFRDGPEFGWEEVSLQEVYFFQPGSDVPPEWEYPPWIAKLVRMGAFESEIKWILDNRFKDITETWDKCEDYGWMRWLLSRLGVDLCEEEIRRRKEEYTSKIEKMFSDVQVGGDEWR